MNLTVLNILSLSPTFTLKYYILNSLHFSASKQKVEDKNIKKKMKIVIDYSSDS